MKHSIWFRVPALAAPATAAAAALVLAAGALAGTFASTGSMSQARSGGTATLLGNGKVLVAGGFGPISGGYYSSLDSAELYDPGSGAFTATGSMTTHRDGDTATLLPSGKVLVAGGEWMPFPTASAELYDPATGTFTATGSMSVTRVQATATLLPSGKVLIAGGWTGLTYTPLATAELYDPGTGTFSPTGSMSHARYGHTATLLADGKVLVTGSANYCCSDFGAPKSAELYDPATGTFSPGGDMFVPRSGHSATLLGDGRVLIEAGDNGGSPPFTAELYDPVTKTFSATGSPLVTGGGATATTLSDGSVLFTGGQGIVSGSYTRLRATEVYIPSFGLFFPLDDMTVARSGHTAARLGDGRVLIAAGYDSSYLASAELFTQPVHSESTAPAITTPGQLTVEATGPDGGKAAFVATASDPDDAARTPSCAPASGSVFPLGTTSVTCVSSDMHWNFAKAAFEVAVVDTTPPDLTVPDDYTVEATSADGAALYPPVSAYDLVDGYQVSIDCTPAIGSMVPLGTTLVSCDASDLHGNTSARATFHVTVVDTTPPSLYADLLDADATSPSGGRVPYRVQAYDAVDAAPRIVCSPPSGSFFPIGDTTIDCSATDFSGNTAEATFTVHVRGAVEQIRNLMDVVSNLGPPATQQLKDALNRQLQAALAAAIRGDRAAACGAMTSFVGIVRLKVGPGGGLSPAQQRQLLEAATRIENVLPCS